MKKNKSKPATKLLSLFSKKTNHGKIKGIYLFNSGVDVDRFFNYCEDAGINFIFTVAYFYGNAVFLKIAKDKGIEVCLNFPVYFDKDYLERNPEYYSIDSRGNKAINDWLHFACPSQPQFLEYQKERLRKLVEYNHPAVICFDFIRFYVFWEKIYPETKTNEITDGCYCEKCKHNFQICSGILAMDKTPQWIKENALKEWADWKCNIITKTVMDLANIVKQNGKDIAIALNIVPWRENDFNGAIRSVAGQDIQQLKKHVDIFIPMTYSHMLKNKPNWIHDVVSDIHVKTGKQVIACIEIEKTHIDKEISGDEFMDMLQFGNLKPSNGIILFHYNCILNSGKNINLQ
jgi:hypothetical protein